MATRLLRRFLAEAGLFFIGKGKKLRAKGGGLSGPYRGLVVIGTAPAAMGNCPNASSISTNLWLKNLIFD
ncbi:hypothetical protein MVG78_13745 [Roseomonas gilardii subsp. gilardii]|uniref:hypothetical protein n=1 Tax=Roseomonas gilardii TaxID=257708 RepID=UPI001FF79D50|nr:hypothetical protein [Roseomonas gilardii]UPG71618.1 hypothetical protein MVG78_13745 [Roseomonas gilardii subsp. gilardii]